MLNNICFGKSSGVASYTIIKNCKIVLSSRSSKWCSFLMLYKLYILLKFLQSFQNATKQKKKSKKIFQVHFKSFLNQYLLLAHTCGYVFFFPALYFFNLIKGTETENNNNNNKKTCIQNLTQNAFRTSKDESRVYMLLPRYIFSYEL